MKANIKNLSMDWDQNGEQIPKFPSFHRYTECIAA